MDPLSTINKLIELAVAESATPEEARTAALTAVKLIRKHQIRLSRQAEPARTVAFGSVNWEALWRTAESVERKAWPRGNPMRADQRPGESDHDYARRKVEEAWAARDVHIPEPSDFWHDRPQPPDDGQWAPAERRVRCAKCHNRVERGSRVYVDTARSKFWCGSCA